MYGFHTHILFLASLMFVFLLVGHGTAGSPSESSPTTPHAIDTPFTMIHSLLTTQSFYQSCTESVLVTLILLPSQAILAVVQSKCFSANFLFSL